MDSKFIVFFRHRRVGEAIEKKLVNMKVKYICIAGHVASGLRAVCLSLIYSTFKLSNAFEWYTMVLECPIFLVYTLALRQVCVPLNANGMWDVPLYRKCCNCSYSRTSGCDHL